MKALTLLLAVLLSGSVFAADMKIGYIDLQKAIQGTTTGKKAKKDLETEFNAKKKELQAKEADLKKQGQEFDKKAAVLSEEVRNQKQMEFQQEMIKFRELVAKSQQDIQKREQDLTTPILDKMNKVIEDFAQKNGYTMILERTAHNVLWSKKEIDITDEIVSAYEKTK